VANTVSVELQIRSGELLTQFKGIIDTLEGVSIKKPEDPGLPDVIILEVGPDFRDDFGLIQSMQRSSACPEFFLISTTEASPEILMQVMRMGIREFFFEPIKEEQVKVAFSRLMERLEREKPRKVEYGKILTVLGSKGGIGTTMIAVNMAVNLAQEMCDVALVDLNLEFGDIPLFLDTEPIHTIAEISENVSRVDSALLEGTLIKHSSGVHILAPPLFLEEAGLVSPEGIEKILNLMREMFDYVVIDAGRSPGPVVLAALNMSEDIFIVTQLDLPSLRNAKRFLDILSRLGYREGRVKMIINRYQNRSEVSLEEAQRILREKAFWLIPNDYPTVISSINQGKSISSSAPNLEITKSFKELALAIQGKEIPKKRRRRLIFF